MTLDIFNQKGLLTKRFTNVNRFVQYRDGSLGIYKDYDKATMSYTKEEVEKEEYAWFELGDK